MKPVVLVIDDDEKLRELLANFLSAYGFNVLQAGTSQEGLSIAFSYPPAVILCDVMLPDALGYETAQALRAHPATGQVPVVMMTGHSAMLQHACAARNKVLLKPFAMSDIVEAVNGALYSPASRN